MRTIAIWKMGLTSASTTTVIAPESASRMYEERKKERAASGTTANATSAQRTTTVSTQIRKMIRNVRHQRPATSLQLRPIAAPSPMFSTNIIGITATQLTQIHTHSGIRQNATI